MDKHLQRKFFGTILEYLRGVQVEAGRLTGILNANLRRVFELEDHLQEWVSEASVIVEVVFRTNYRISEKYAEPPPGPPQPLEKVLGMAELEQLVKEIVEFFDSIPYTSTFWAQLRGVKLAIDEPIAVGPFRLRVVGNKYKPRPKNPMVLALAGEKPLPPDLNAEEVVIEMTVEGYSRQRISDSSPTKALSLVKEFVVLADAIDVLATGGSVGRPQPTPLLCEVKNDDPHVAWVEDVPPNAARHVDAYGLSDEITARLRGLLDPWDEKNPYVDVPEADRVKRVRSRLARLARVFASDADKHVVSLRTAAQWHFDSLAENNETTAFLFVSLGLEALLGGTKQETEGIGLQKLLANRLAYLLGGDGGTREKLINEFAHYYNKRSALVHGRALRLDQDGKKWLKTGRLWLSQAIRKEVRSLLLPPPEEPAVGLGDIAAED